MFWFIIPGYNTWFGIKKNTFYSGDWVDHMASVSLFLTRVAN